MIRLIAPGIPLVMAAEASNVNGNKSLAAMLEEKHEKDAAHKATVETVPDEEDIQHPPPSSLVNESKLGAPAAAPTPAQAAPAPTPNPAFKPSPKNAPALDVQSEELFPALGSGPKPTTPAAATWGAKPSAAAAVANGSKARMSFPTMQCKHDLNADQTDLNSWRVWSF